MNPLYHIAILEGYLSQYPELPRGVQDAIAYFKEQAMLTPVHKAKKKRKVSLEHMARMRASAAAARASKADLNANIIWTPGQIQKLREMKESGFTYAQIAEHFGGGITVKAVANAAYRNNI